MVADDHEMFMTESLNITPNKTEQYLTLRLEVGVKLTPDPINCLIFKNDFNLYRRDFAIFNISSLPSIWHT